MDTKSITLDIIKELLTKKDKKIQELTIEDFTLKETTEQGYVSRDYLYDIEGNKKITSDNTTDNTSHNRNQFSIKKIITLAAYFEMNIKANKRGKIIFYKENIALYISYLIRSIVNKEMKNINVKFYFFTVYFIITDLMQHETFHHYCDFKRKLTESNFILNTEEGLAVANSALYFRNMDILRDKFIKDFRFTFDSEESCELYHLYARLVKHHFYEFYILEGYKDWPQYSNDKKYDAALYKYLKKIDTFDELKKMKIPVDNLRPEMNAIGNYGCDIKWG